MELLTKNTLKILAAAAEPPCVTLILPLERVPAEAEMNAKRLKGALSDVEQRLATLGLSPKGRIQFLADARRLADEAFREPPEAEGVALFLSVASAQWFLLPQKPRELLFLGERFLLTPLLPFVQDDDRYCVLAMSGNACRLVQVTGGKATEVPVPGMPVSQADAWYGMGQGQEAPTEDMTARFRAISPQEEETARDTYARSVAKALESALAGQRMPLVFAGVEELYGLLRKHCDYPRLAEGYVRGNPDDLSSRDLALRAQPHALPLLQSTKEDALRAFEAAAGIGRTSVSARDILAAAKEGRVACLLLADGVSQWGNIDPETGEIAVHVQREDKDEDLCGLAATETLVRDGEAVVLPPERMPLGAAMGAVLRY